MVRRSLLLAVLAAGISAAVPMGALDEICVGDCDLDRRVDIVDLITAVSVVLGAAPLNACPSIFCDQDGPAAISCLIAAIDHALHDDCDSGGIPCGNTVCRGGEICCNPLFNVCSPPDQPCIQ